MIFFYKEALKIPLPYRRNRSGVITSEISYSLSKCITVDDNFRNYSVSKFDILTLKLRNEAFISIHFITSLRQICRI